MRGMALGGYIDGIAVSDGRFAGEVDRFFSAFGVVTGLGLLAGCALLGATWLVFKTAGTT